MIRLFVTFLFSFFVFKASSQRIYFIYLQTDPQQAFFVKMDEKLLSSSASGYLILPRLKDSTYTFTVGFNSGGEHKFTCSVNKKDHGYLLKSFGEKGWGLYDLQTSAVQMEISGTSSTSTQANGPVNAFTDLLSRAADDSTLKQKIVLPAEPTQAVAVAKNEPAPDTQVSKPVKDSVVVVKKESVATPANNKTEPKKKEDTAAVVVKQKQEVQKPVADETKIVGTPAVNAVTTASVKEEIKAPEKTQTVVKEKPKEPEVVKSSNSFSKSKIVRKSESSTTEGFGLSYDDTYADGKQDTIILIIPNDNKVKLTNSTTATTTVSNVIETPVVEKAKAPASNNCKAVATDDDFFKLRKKMAAEKSDNGMIQEAAKIFKSKCFTTAQLKNLGTLFIGDGGKYQFFDSAYSSVSDIENFPSLSTELKDQYFVNRFKAMIK